MSTPRIILKEGSSQGKAFPLDRERLSIGRHAENDICLPDRSVSGRHAVVVTMGGASFLEDLDSTNGTLVNGKSVARHQLADGDEFTIGRNQFRYEGLIAAEEDFERTMVLSSRDTAPQSPANGGRTTAKLPAAAKLRVSGGNNDGKELQLTKALTTLGKPGVQVAAITRRVDGYYIVHVTAGGASGKRPTVNGEPVGVTARKLIPGDRIELAGTLMVFES